MDTGEFNAGGNPAMDLHPIQGEVEILLVSSCYGNQDKLQPDGPLGSYGDFTYLPKPKLENYESENQRLQYFSTKKSKKIHFIGTLNLINVVLPEQIVYH